jgi:hypothetical protein
MEINSRSISSGERLMLVSLAKTAKEFVLTMGSSK